MSFVFWILIFLFPPWGESRWLSGGGLFAQQCNIIYVTPNGASSGAAGTKANPASLFYALTLVNASDNRIHMASGTYLISNPVYLVSNVTIEGGYNPGTWVKSNSAATVIQRDNQNVETLPSRLVALYGISISNFFLQDLTIRTVDVFGNGISTYTLYLSGCSSYSITRCKILAGSAGNGNSGSSGTDGISGADGYAGLDGEEDGACCTAGGPGGCCTFAGSNSGGKGGDGGPRGYYTPPIDGDAYPGYPGQQGQGLGGGVGGGGGIKIVVTIYPTSCARTVVNDGQPGATGASGQNGTPGTAGAYYYSGGYFWSGDGTPGTEGTDGAGGGGGGGGGSIGGIIHDWPFNGFPPNQNGSGAGGGGGGEGGQRAQGGQGGRGGGGSFAVFLYNNGSGGVIRDCFIKAGSPGLGGTGGNGGTSGYGGKGGPGGGKYNCNVGAGGDGGDGGDGGEGGKGGDGDNGVSYEIYEYSGGTPVDVQNIYSLQQAFVTVNATGCTYAPVVFSTPSTGTVEWYFGAGASPAFATGNPATTSYSTTGKKTFTMVVNGIPYTFTTFIDIYSNGAGLNPVISATDTNICQGDFITFSSSVTGATNYFWYITGDNYYDSLSGAGLNVLNSYPFDSAGTYRIVHYTVNSCCGISFPDTFDVSVEGFVQPSVVIQASDTTALCENEPVIFSATAADVGASPTYIWFLNGVVTGSNSPTFTSTSIDSGDVVQCVVISSLGCSSGLMDSSNTITIIEVTAPTVTCAADSFEAGAPTYFTSLVTSGGMAPYSYIWSFGDSTIGFGDSVAHIYPEPGSYAIQVDVTDVNGCANSCNVIVTITTSLSAKFAAGNITGCAPLTVDFTNQSTNAITYLWNFGDGNTSYLKDPQHTYTSPGFYSVTLYAYGGSGTAVYTMPNQIFVYPAPVANFQAFPSNIAPEGDTVFFADNSWGATSWSWNFGDPSSGSGDSSSLQNPYHYYSVIGNYTVTLIVTNEYNCSDTIIKQNFITITSGMDELRISDFGFRIYPNPFTNVANIVIYKPPAAHIENVSFMMYDIFGKRVKLIETEENLIEIHRNGLQNGLYFYRVLSENETIGIGKIVIE
ncbi:MAG: PKD domain-containing protein [Bacteroidetes bacterium]|nr:PKD domain-containing protein [Bacteroidota bacterium]